MIKKLSIILILLSTAVTCSFIHKVNAQEAVRTFTISPPTVQLELNPGESAEGTLKITNDGVTSLNFNTSIRDFIVTSEDGTPEILPVNAIEGKYSGASWVAIYPNQIYVSPKQKTEFKYYIQVPSNARPGGHYAAVIYTPTTNTGSDNGSGAAVNTSVGSLFYITVKGPVTENATITKFDTKNLWESAPEILTTEIKNLSDIHISPKGTIKVKNMIGQQSEVVAFPKSNIFPGATRGYHTNIGKGFMLGRYTADLNLTYGKDNKALMATTSFWVIPWKIILVIIVAIIVIVGIVIFIKKRRGSKHNEPNEPTQPERPAGA